MEFSAILEEVGGEFRGVILVVSWIVIAWLARMLIKSHDDRINDQKDFSERASKDAEKIREITREIVKTHESHSEKLQETVKANALIAEALRNAIDMARNRGGN